MRSFLMLVLVAASFSFVGCGKDSESKAYSYEFEQNGCKTGRHSFSTVSAMCDALQNESLNRGCALDLRVDYFEQSCGNQVFQYDMDGSIGFNGSNHHRDEDRSHHNGPRRHRRH